MNADVKLVAKGESLFFPDSVRDNYGEPGPILLCRYDEGDCDTINWPDPNEDNLRSVLFDAVEMGYIHETDRVLLPDGKHFEWNT